MGLHGWMDHMRLQLFQPTAEAVVWASAEIGNNLSEIVQV